MKSYNHLMEKYLSDENYYLAVRNATRHKGGKKRKYRKAQYYKNNAEKLKPIILNYAKNFKNMKHKFKKINDGIRRKQRQIIVPNIKEQIVHHMIVNILKPIFMKSMYEHSYGSIPNRGPHLAKKRIEKWIKYDSYNTKYCLKMDIKKYFESISHSILKNKFAKIIHDKQFLLILYEIIDVIKSDKGIPIGFYTSQWIANWYLTNFDHYLKEKLHIIKNEIEKYLNIELGLNIKENWQIFLFAKRGLDFMGFRFFLNKTILRKSIMLNASRKAKRVSKKIDKTIYDCRQMLSYLGWLKCTNTYNMYKKYIKPNIAIKHLKTRISIYQKKINKEVLCGT